MTKGVVRAEGTHFRYEGGGWFHPFGTTVYALMYQPRERIDLTLRTLEDAPFNKLRFCLFPKFFDYNREEPEWFPFEREGDAWRTDRPFEPFWAELERRIDQLGRMGIQCDLILFHPYDRWGFAELNPAQAAEYLTYAVRRLAGHPNIWWCLANEYDIMAYTDDDWRRFARIIRENDPYGHLLGIHNMVIPWDPTDSAMTHLCLQLKNVDDVSRTISQYGKPLMVDECGYEGNIPMEWGNLSAFALVDRFWKICAQGGYASHGETFVDENDVLWWSKGGTLKGESPSRIAFLRDILESLPGPLTYAGHDMTPEEVEWLTHDPPEAMRDSPFACLAPKLTWEQTYQMLMDNKEFRVDYEERAMLVYYTRHCTAAGKLDLPKTHTYTVEVIDVWNMKRETVLRNASGPVTVRLPGREGIAVLATADEACL